jgi:uncharacterized damage-inducible protein DinB
MKFQLDSAREILKRTPATLNSLLNGLPDEWIFSNEGAGSWTPFDVVGHLIHGEETDWIPRIKVILNDGETGTFEPFDRFAMFEKSRGKNLSDLLAKFEQLRAESLNELGKLNLTPDLLGKQANHPELGKVTLGELLSTWVVHDLSHIGQIVRLMAKRYKEDVGAWQNYLSILK